MLQGSRAAPGWSVKVIHEVVKYIDGEVAYLGDVIAFDSGPTEHMANSRTVFERLRFLI